MRAVTIAAILLLWNSASAGAAVAISLSSAASGVTLGGTSKAATMNLGSGNGLAVGTAAAGVVRVSPASGPVYSSPFSITLTGWGNGASVTVTAHVSTAFGHPTAIQATHCEAADCTVAANHSLLSTSAAARSAVRSGLANNSVFTANVGALIVYLNGGSAFTGADSATITFTAIDANNTARSDTATMTLTANVQQALQFSLDTSSALSVSAGSTTDYLMDFGTVDGLGVSSGNGATRGTSATGALYSTSYLARPAFSSMASTTGTVRMYVSSNFAHTGLLQLQDSSTGAANSFSAISTNSAAASQTLLSASAASRSDLTRYLGLFVFNVNGAGAFVGADSAVITYTLIVP